MVELPSGTVTFLFTDVEGSTRLVKQLRDRYGQVLADHRRILRAAFEAHGGHEIDTQGDSFFFAFPRAKDAVVAVVEAQRALTGHEWPEGGEVRVRMGCTRGSQPSARSAIRASASTAPHASQPPAMVGRCCSRMRRASWSRMTSPRTSPSATSAPIN